MKYQKSNKSHVPNCHTCHKNVGDRVEIGDVIADGTSIKIMANQHLERCSSSIHAMVMVIIMKIQFTYKKWLKKMNFSSIHIQEYEAVGT